MGEYDSPQRPLRFPYRNPIGPLEITTEDAEHSASSIVWPEDSDEKIDIVMHLSLNEYVVLSSTIDVGSDIAYGKDAFRVMWLWMTRNFNMTEICEQIIDCVENDGDVIDAISDSLFNYQGFQEDLAQYIADHPSGTIYPKGQPIPETTRLTITQPSCDKDLLWAQCIGLVQTANRMITDFLERWETYTNQGEVVSDIVNAIPLVSEAAQISGVAGIIEYANDLVDTVAEEYADAYDLAYEIALACELFCAAQPGTDDGCFVTSKMAADILNARIGNALNLSNIAELIFSLMDMDVSGFNVADLYMAAFFNFIAIGNLVIPTTWGLDTFLAVMVSFNTPSDDWESVCEECPVIPNACVNFLEGNHETWIPTGNDGSWAQFTFSGVGQENPSSLGLWGIDYTNVHSITVRFSANAWTGVNDYYKFYAIVSDLSAGNTQYYGGPFDLKTGDEFTLTTTGDNWATLAIQIFPGGGAWPPNAGRSDTVYIEEICVEFEP